ncbi:hypothetical protein [Alteribacter natronophilus]|uniref:hypothetical protein n=1 Tax=Alteribacter natronophilus TaxID=2583810 RepID=UPI00110E4E2A|nr:hypothetical protein [Alteribacter natronophilus]TMW72302.1 hypothetical protein FGB90_08825 [Alteribacter natronophilus]
MNRVKRFFSRVSKKDVWMVFTAILTLLAVSFGVWSYAAVPGFTPLDSAYSAVRLFTFSVDLPAHQAVPWQLELARWLAMFVVISNVIWVLAVKLRHHLRMFMLKLPFRKSHYIITGLTDEVSVLAAEIKKRRIVIIAGRDAPDQDVERLRAAGCIVIHKGTDEAGVFQQAGILRAKGVFVMDQEDHNNVESVLRINRLLLNEKNRSKDSPSPLTCYVHLNEGQYKRVIDEVWAEQGKNEKPLLDIRVFNHFENSARCLFDQMPLYRGQDLSKKAGYHLVVLGFGKTGRSVLLEAVRRSHFSSHKKLNVTVVDRESDQRKAELDVICPELKKACEINFINMDVYTPEFYRYINRISESITYIAVCFDNDHLDFVSASFLTELVSHAPLAVRMSSASDFAGWLEQNKNKYESVCYFGTLEEAAAYGRITGKENEETAIELHDAYENLKQDLNEGGKITSWKKLDRFRKESNIAQADHLDTKLAVLGLEKIKKESLSDFSSVVTSEEFERRLAPVFRDLVIMEHNRWNAFHFADGWKTRNADLSPKDTDRKEHVCLVSWDELRKVEEKQKRNGNEYADYRAYDEIYIKQMYDLLKKAGYELIPLS